MPQNIVIQVGQCGNQIGSRFWDKILQEEAHYSPTDGSYEESLATFFSNFSKGHSLSVGDRISHLKARAVLVDMEEGVLGQIKRSQTRHLFNEDQFVTSVSGSGNNWAVGYHSHGSAFRDQILESVRIQAERCDALESFFTIFSLGGGTGSGLGSFITELLSEEYPESLCFSNVVVPSADDDVVISPYNSLLDCSDCVLPVDNESLIRIHRKIEHAGIIKTSLTAQVSSATEKIKQKGKNGAFDTMNNIVANLLCNLTSSMRFEGSLNVDINDITTNMVPFPRLKFLSSGMAPLYVASDVKLQRDMRVDQLFSQVFSPECQLTSCSSLKTFLGCCVIARGQIPLSDIRRSIEKLTATKLQFVDWNQEAWKVGLCSAPMVNQSSNLLALSNNSSIAEPFDALRSRFRKLLVKKAHLHHYLEYMDKESLVGAHDNVASLVGEYQALDSSE